MGTVQVDRIIDRHGRERASLIAILQDIQDEFNWVCEDHLRHVASELKLPLTQVYGVASFYRALSLVPRGKSIIKVCMGTACHVRGAQLIVDELGFVPFDRAGGELLFNLLSDRYERRSTIVTTNLAFSEWVQVLGDEKLTTALLDRLAHNAHILTTKGVSFRTRKRRK